MKRLLLISLFFIYSCATTPVQKSNVVYIYPEKDHYAKENIEWTKTMTEDAKKGDINLYLEGYFPETSLEKNVYGIDDPKLAAVTQAFFTYIDIQYFIENVYTIGNVRQYMQAIENSFVIYDQAEYLRSVKDELGFDYNKVKDVTELQNFCADFLNYHGKRNLKDYQYIFDSLTKKHYLGEKRFMKFWEDVVIKHRDKLMVENFMHSHKKVKNSKDSLLIIGHQHLQGIGKLLVDNGFEVRVLHKKK